MGGISHWLKKTVQALIDPEREERVQTLVKLMQQGLRTSRQNFSLSAALRGVEFFPKDLEAAQAEVFRAILRRGWSDNKLTADEREVARWVAACLQIPEAKARELNIEIAKSCFATAMADAMEDGILDGQEEARLQEIAASCGMSLPEFAGQFFHHEGEGFLRSIFLACVADGRITQREWNYLLSVTQKLGIRHDELLRCIQPQAQSFVEQVLADAKSDGRLSPQEDATLSWLMDNLGLAPTFRRYVEQEVTEIRWLTEIADGKLRAFDPPVGVEVRAGEIVYFFAQATWEEMRVLKSGPRCDFHSGVLVFTDNRLLFSSPTKSQSFSFRKVVAHHARANRIVVQIEGKAAYEFVLAGRSPFAYPIFCCVVGRVNQTRIAKDEGAMSRHIPRDVRQRVWQRYGARCAECGATDYLEFDHIIPVAKGGSNSDANVQLLCRHCNLKKSDRI